MLSPVTLPTMHIGDFQRQSSLMAPGWYATSTSALPYYMALPPDGHPQRPHDSVNRSTWEQHPHTIASSDWTETFGAHTTIIVLRQRAQRSTFAHTTSTSREVTRRHVDLVSHGSRLRTRLPLPIVTCLHLHHHCEQKRPQRSSKGELYKAPSRAMSGGRGGGAQRSSHPHGQAYATPADRWFRSGGALIDPDWNARKRSRPNRERHSAKHAASVSVAVLLVVTLGRMSARECARRRYSAHSAIRGMCRGCDWPPSQSR